MGIRELLGGHGVRSVFQPIVELDSGDIVAYEALARGPVGPLERPDRLFAAARAEGLLAELDEACRAAAFRGALASGLLAPLTLFVNVEPEVLDSAPLDDLLALAAGAPGELRVVVEITERAIAARPAELLRTVARVRELGWGVALDDVGADAMSLAFMPLLRPDVVKLDLRLVQERPGAAVAEIMHAVNAYAQESGATVLAEGIEDERHLAMARALGAHLGQGWLFGRPGPAPVPGLPAGELRLPAAPAVGRFAESSPFALLPPGTPLRRSPKSLLIELSKQLEREALRIGSTCVVAATFQEARHFTPATTGRYRDLVERTGFVCALGEGLPAEPLPGLRGAALDPRDPVRGEWDVVVLGPHFAVALLARDLGDSGPDARRTFEYALTYDRATVVAAAHSLLSRVAPRTAAAPVGAAPAGVVATAVAAGATTAAGATAAAAAARAAAAATAVAGPGADASVAERVLQRVLGTTSHGVTIADVTRPDQPLVYVNTAFEVLSGLRSEQVLGRNCRFLQGPGTDPAVLAALRAAVEDGREWSGVLLNHRGPGRTPWWNEIQLAPVRDADGRVVRYVGLQNDVTERVEAQRALEVERDRTRAHLRRIEDLARTDALTGLPNRRLLADRVAGALAAGDEVALLLCDLDGFKAINDRFGHGAGDDLLVAVAGRLRDALPPGGLAARLGGDEFIVALTAPPGRPAPATAQEVAARLARSVADPIALGGVEVSIRVSVGVATAAAGDGVEDLLHRADEAMHERKRARRGAGFPAPVV
ncbi:EAL domain-containing protein [Kineococcus sp. TRM81007]|uniref:EAL domain-containing protein n=1 Tax=Kineococcus sp. TRM81007 TaxID=2925831 RepID=UPI001F58DB4D|nr:EAL domain-containing protein [Kineococcus sp. TRM81007]MCI2238174.1 EAL domain-containing protein [Kineococcus sp. TRM81007]